MEITEVRVRLVKDEENRLKAVCTVTFDDEFVVRDVKVVEGSNGLFVAMPSRKLSASCPKCRHPNHLRARYCNECGRKLPPMRIPADENGKAKAHRDIAHPVTPAFRQMVQSRVLEAFRYECERADERGYEPAAFETDDSPEEGMTEYDSLISDLKRGRPDRPGPRHEQRRGDDERRPRRRRRRGRDREEQRRPAREERDRRPLVVADEDQEPEEPRDEAPTDADESAQPDRDAGGFGAGLDQALEERERRPQTRERPAATAPSQREEPAEAAQPHEPDSPGESDDQDDTPFGAGIL